MLALKDFDAHFSSHRTSADLLDIDTCDAAVVHKEHVLCVILSGISIPGDHLAIHSFRLLDRFGPWK